MEIKMTKYCIMTADLKEVEVGTVRQFHFIPVADLEKSKSKINLFNSKNTAVSSFGRCWWDATWDAEKDAFVNIQGKLSWIVKKLTVTYSIELED